MSLKLIYDEEKKSLDIIEEGGNSILKKRMKTKIETIKAENKLYINVGFIFRLIRACKDIDASEDEFDILCDELRDMLFTIKEDDLAYYVMALLNECDVWTPQ